MFSVWGDWLAGDQSMTRGLGEAGGGGGVGGFVAGVGGGFLRDGYAAGYADHGGCGPPGLALVGAGAGEGGGEEEAGAGADGGPEAGFAEVVDAGPEELAGVLGVVAHGYPLLRLVGVFGADDGAGGLSAWALRISCSR